MFRRKTLVPILGLLMLAAPMSACRKGSAPVLQFLADQEAVVGQTLTLHVVAIDPEGDAMDFRFEAPAVPDITNTAAMSTGPDGQGIFTFTPLASQLGTHFFDFYASDGRNEGRLTIAIDVKGAVGSGTLPIFRKPLGSGTVLDLDSTDTVALDIEIEDADSSSVELSAAPPIIDDSNLNGSSNGLSGSWDWTPTREQIAASDRYDLTLSADDGDNPPTLKDFIIVIRKRGGEDCPGGAPSIDHDAGDFATQQDLKVSARITDDQGLGSEPYLLYSLTDPGDPIDFTQMILVEMKLDSGDMRDGTWTGSIPNPVANEAEGTEADLFYLISASDDDDADGDCDHRVDAPSSGTYQVVVTNEAGDPGEACDDCSFDVQCGGAGDLCIASGSNPFCGSGCEDDDDCDTSFICSPSLVDSVDGAAARQCIPNSGSCSGGGGPCTDDDDEPNNDPGSASGPITAGTDRDLTLCSGNEDWFEITLSASARVTATLAGDSPPDMDLALTTSAGVLIKNSVGLTSDEVVVSPSCLAAGTYALRVYSFDSAGSGEYSLGYTVSTATCGGGGGGDGDCCEDNNTPGCDEPAVETCVCGMDAFCCDTEWDNTCATIAEDDCDACDGGTGGPNMGCCTVQTSPGCTDMAIQSCVCGLDPFCCSDTWDSVCVGKVGSFLCGPSCNPADADGYCCADNGTPGCEINSIETCVCMADSFCCDVEWDADCVAEIAASNCSTAMCPS